MSERKIQLKPKKERKKLNLKLSGLFESKKRRYFFMFLFMLPFLAAMLFFGNMAYTEIKNILALASGGQVEIKDENLIESMEYVLRDNATELQKDYFAQLKSAVEEEEFDDVKVAELVAKNYVADFYTWTNKQGQFDVGGMHYIYGGEFPNGDHFKENVFLAARDGFYKYIGNYMTDYGVENLLEVIDVEVTKCEKQSQKYKINEHVANLQDENGEWYDHREDYFYDAYIVSCKWTYNPETPLTLSKFTNQINLLIVNREGKFVIVEASESPINIEKVENETESEQDTEKTQEDSQSNAG